MTEEYTAEQKEMFYSLAETALLFAIAICDARATGVSGVEEWKQAAEIMRDHLGNLSREEPDQCANVYAKTSLWIQLYNIV